MGSLLTTAATARLSSPSSTSTRGVFDGTPGAVRSDRWGDEADRQAAFDANGYVWPPQTQYVGWPPRPGAPFSATYLDSRDEVSGQNLFHFRFMTGFLADFGSSFNNIVAGGNSCDADVGALACR